MKLDCNICGNDKFKIIQNIKFKDISYEYICTKCKTTKLLD